MPGQLRTAGLASNRGAPKCRSRYPRIRVKTKRIAPWERGSYAAQKAGRGHHTPVDLDDVFTVDRPKLSSVVVPEAQRHCHGREWPYRTPPRASGRIRAPATVCAHFLSAVSAGPKPPQLPESLPVAGRLPLLCVAAGSQPMRIALKQSPSRGAAAGNIQRIPPTFNAFLGYGQGRQGSTAASGPGLESAITARAWRIALASCPRVRLDQLHDINSTSSYFPDARGDSTYRSTS